MDSKREGNLGHTVGYHVGRFSLVLLAVLIVSAAVAPPAKTSGVKWVTKRVGWDGAAAYGAGIALSSGGKDTIQIVGATNPVDSNRTVQINTGDWAWEQVLTSGYNAATVTSSADSLISVALLTVTCQARTAGNRIDTLYAVPEYCMAGSCGHSDIAHSGVSIAGCYPLVADPQSKWGGAITGTNPYTVSGNAAVVYQGYIKVDPNSSVSGGQGFTFRPNVRFNIIPAGTMNGFTLYSCRAYITYPQRSQP